MTKTEASSAIETYALISQAQSMLVETMLLQHVSRAELARRMGVSRARVTQMLDPDRNLTLRSLATALAAMGCYLHLEVRPQERGI
jgi:transcriptional regulator with XRE-family HTH domain